MTDATDGPDHFADRLLAACDRAGAPICVGIDPVFDRLPDALRIGAASTARGRVDAIDSFCRRVVDVVAPVVPCVKIQSACFERYLWPGVEAFHKLVEHARNAGLLVIADAKRGDIGISAAHYAAGSLEPTPFDDLGRLQGADALTVNGYLGADALAPFIEAAQAEGRGLFVLVRTSNPGGAALQGLTLADGRAVVDAVAGLVADAGSGPGRIGRSGYSLVGAVVGATCAEDAARLRGLMPRQVFLVPGFGAQGGGADDVAACFQSGAGAVVTASRSILYAYEAAAGNWQDAVREACVKMKQEVGAVAAAGR